ncbi:MAG: penicillin-binding protein 1C [Desulfovibrio sp.]|nr:penicillin-binding protein 1C [Desulfovibrio sp.]
MGYFLRAFVGSRAVYRLAALFLGPFLFIWLFWLALGLVPVDPLLSDVDFSTVLEDRDGRLLRITLTTDQKYRLYTPLSSIPSWALERVIEYEDRYFWEHPGVNVGALARSVMSIVSGGRRMGGSTLTMQTARLRYHLYTQSVFGKLQQIFWALCLERHFTKEEILEAYFCLAPYGGNVEGLESAAQIYFHKKTSRLTREEAEALMLVPQNPVRRRPSMDNPHFQAARERLRTRAEDTAPLRIRSVSELPFRAPHFVQDVLSQVEKDGKSSRAPLRTTLDGNRQKILEEQIRRFVARNAAFGLKNASALLVHWPSSEVRALVGSADFSDASIGGQIDGTRIRRSPGSTLKPFIYALALEQGLIHPRTILADTPKSFQGYDPENFDHSFKGPVSAEYALRSSRNLPAIALAQKLRSPDLYTFLAHAGVRFQKSASHYGLALVLGGAEVSMREEAELYALLANKGVRRPLRMLFGATDTRGQSVLSPEASFVTCQMLLDPRSDKYLRTERGRLLPVRLKTGTSNGFRDAWTCGIFGPYVLIVWIGNFDNRANPLLVGGRVAEPLFMDIAQRIARSEPLVERLSIPDSSVNVERIEVCTVSGDVDTSLCEDRTETWFIPGVSPVRKTGILRRITVNSEGLRACFPEEGKTKEIVWEFWPSDLGQLFARAGLPKPPPPPFEEACRGQERGNPPRITSPKRGLIYYAYGADRKARIALLAHADAGTKEINWYVNGVFVGNGSPGSAFPLELAPGSYHIMAVDDSLRSSVIEVPVLARP